MLPDSNPPAVENPGRTEPRRRPWIWLSLVGVVIVAAILAAAVLLREAGSPTEAGGADPLNLAEVVITDLVQEETFDGMLSYVDADPVTTQIGGTVTEIAAPGATVRQGEVLFAIDNQPVVLLYGDLPAFRDIAIGEDIVTLSSPLNGTITWVAEPGSVIQQGDVLYRVDDQPVVALYGDLPAYRRLGLLAPSPQVLAAQANLAAAKANLEALTSPPSEQQLQAARANLDSAKQALQELLALPDPDAAQIAKVNLTAAEMNHQAAQAQLNVLLEGPDPDAVEQASLNLDQAQNSLWNIQLQRDAINGNPGTPGYVKKQMEAQVANAEIAVRQAEIAYQQAQEGATDEAIAAARASVAAVGAQLASAQLQYNQAQEGASPAQIASAQAQVAQAQAVLDALLAGPGPDQVAAAEAQVAQAQAALDALLSEASPAAPGPDVQQLEEALVALGYDPDGAVTADDEFTSETQEMVKAWQEDIGAEADGVVELGEVVFLPGPAQVLDVLAPPGSQAGGGVVGVATGDPATGADIRQLEEALVALGYDADGALVADGTYTLETYQAVLAFQADHGLAPDGIIGLGEDVFLPGPVRVTSQMAVKGSGIGMGSMILDIALAEKAVYFGLPAKQQGILAVGDAVTVELPDDTLVPATLTSISQTATPAAGGAAVFEVRVSLDDPQTVAALDEAPVDVIVVSDSVEDVMAVPVSALVALLEGGYAVEVDIGGGQTQLVPVEVGFFGSNNMVQITSAALQPGDRVVVP